MDIVYNCDDGYVKYTAVSICSLYENNRSVKELRVHILGNGISEASKEKLNAMAAGYGRVISFYELCGFEDEVKMLAGGHVDAGKFTVTALARLFAARILPKELNRILYMDCDTLVLGELRELWELDLQGYTAAMAAEPTIYPEVKAGIGISEYEPYFNAGMILIDTERWKKDRILEEAMDYYRDNNGRLPFSDQDLINHTLKGRVKPVSQKYNFITNYHYQSYAYLIRNAAWYKDCVSCEDWKSAVKNPVMVHFAGDERPWIKGSFNPYKKEFLYYRSLTPWAFEELIDGKRTYMLLYHVMNIATKLFPPVRSLISKVYYRNYIDA